MMDLKVISWNVNLHSETGMNIKKSNSIFYAIKNMNPDIILLQESSFDFNNMISSLGYSLVKSTTSHRGYISSFVRKNIPYEHIQCYEIHRSHIFAIFDGKITIANIHYEPFYSYIKNDILYSVNIFKTDIIVGDTNFKDDLNIEGMIDVGKTYGDTWFNNFSTSKLTTSERYDRVISSISLSIKNFHLGSDYYGLSEHIPMIFTIS
jgi:hypothetical protein